MNASSNEVTLILDAIKTVRHEVEDLRADVAAQASAAARSAEQLNDRIRVLERFRWQLVGAATLATVMLSVALRILLP